MSKWRDTAKHRLALRKKNASIALAIPILILMLIGVFSAIQDVQSGNLTKGMRFDFQPYGPFLRLGAFGVGSVVAIIFLVRTIRSKPGPTDPAHD
jgi:hypothetical protein